MLLPSTSRGAKPGVGSVWLLVSLLLAAQVASGDFKAKLAEHRKLDAGVHASVGGLVIMDLATAAEEQCGVDGWQSRVDAFSKKNGLTEDESMLLGYYCILYGRGAIAGAAEIVKAVKGQ